MARACYCLKLCNLSIFLALGAGFGPIITILFLLSVLKHQILETQRPYKICNSSVSQLENTTINVSLKHEEINMNISVKSTYALKQPLELINSIEDVPKEGDSRLREVWSSSLAKRYYACTKPTKKYPTMASKSRRNGYLIIETNGELSLQRVGIADSVAIARILDVTMVLPSLVHEDNDTSQFEDIFDVKHFISSLAEDVRIIRALPTNENLIVDIPIFVTQKKYTPISYKIRLISELQTKPVIEFTKTANKLHDNWKPDLQKLKCRVNYNALRFVHPLANLGQKLVQRIREYSKTGQYVAVYIKFDQELLSTSGCYFGGGRKELRDLGVYRKHGYRPKDPYKERREGRCPLTPVELGLFLRALGFGSNTFLYIVMGSIYGGDKTLSPLWKLFPNHYTRDTLAREEELASLQPYQSRLAAIDYTICKESNVFVVNENNDMAKIMARHRRFSGHQRTIIPNFQELSLLYIARYSLGWYQFASKARIFQEGFTRETKEEKRGENYEALEACICAKGEFKLIKRAHGRRKFIKEIHKQNRNSSINETEHEWTDTVEEKEERETITGEILNFSINESLKLDEGEEDDISEEWPWMMN